MKRNSQIKDNEVVAQLLHRGLSLRKVAAQQARVSLSVVQRVKREQNIERVVPAVNGRPCKLSARMKSTIKRYIVRDKAGTAVKANKMFFREYGLFLGTNTVRRALHEGGLQAIEKKKKPALSAKHQKDRYEWALHHKHWAIMDD